MGNPASTLGRGEHKFEGRLCWRNGTARDEIERVGTYREAECAALNLAGFAEVKIRMRRQ
jgi:hypothetical protein